MKTKDDDFLKENQIRVVKPFGPAIAWAKIPDTLVKNLNNYIDKIIEDKKKLKELDHGKGLVGDVTQEFKLEKDFAEKIGWIDFLKKGTSAWISLATQKKITKFDLISSWVIRQFKGEYNPLHWHGGHISGVGYLKIPKFISKNKNKTNIDGTIDFINGNKMFLSDSIYNHQPKVGDVILFPHYLMHTAYPFKSNEERRSFSFNLEIDSKIANVFSNE